MAALCHDVGHLPSSHAAEKELLPNDWDHEKLTREIIVSDEMKTIWESIVPLLRPEHIDYLLRDSHHVGVVYGKFDHHRLRLIDTLRILPPAQSGENEKSQEPALGVEEGGIQSAEALMLARYFMYSQVYFHPVRRMSHNYQQTGRGGTRWIE